MTDMARRSVLFSPGTEEALLRKAAGTDADCLVFDLEDAVSPEDKAAARETVRSVLSDPEFDPEAEVCVRVNGDGIAMDDDLQALTASGSIRLDSVMLPKAESAGDVETLAGLLGEHDIKVPIMALLETAAGVLHAESIAGSDPVDAVVFGAEDLAADIGATRTDEGTEVLHAREHVVLAASAHGVDAIDTIHADFRDDAGLRESTRFAVQLGYDGKLAIHPDQVPIINGAFTPDQSDIEWAERVLEAEAAAETAVFEVDGEMIDAPLIAQAERIRERARAAGEI